MKILVVYATRSGCTEDIARRVGQALRRGGADVKVIPADAAPSVQGFDAVIVGSGIRAGKWHGVARRWMAKNVVALRRIPHAIFTVCLTMKDGQSKAAEVLAYTQPMVLQYDLKPAGVGLFAGWYEPDRFGFFERLVLKMIKAPRGDYRDYAAVDSWVSVVAPRLGLEIAMESVSVEQTESVIDGESLQVEM